MTEERRATTREKQQELEDTVTPWTSAVLADGFDKDDGAHYLSEATTFISSDHSYGEDKIISFSISIYKTYESEDVVFVEILEHPYAVERYAQGEWITMMASQRVTRFEAHSYKEALDIITEMYGEVKDYSIL